MVGCASAPAPANMRWRTQVIVVLLAAPFAVAALLFFSPANRARTTAEATRRVLRDRGFKLEFKDFQRTDLPQVPSTLEVLIQASYAYPHLYDQGAPRLMQPIGSNAAAVVWNQARLQTGFVEDLWPELRRTLGESRAKLDPACAAILAGPIRCELGVLWSGELMNTNAGIFKRLSFSLSSRTLLELHDGNRNTAWTNLMALTRLVTAWQIEPSEHSHMVRMALLPTALATTWQALQPNFWTDSQLAALQREWESLELLPELPETAALAGANAVMLCRLDREPESDSASLRQKAHEVLRSPQGSWHDLLSRYQAFSYRTYGSYEDENALMLYFRERQGEIKRATSARSWSEMRSLPGVTNRVPLPSTPNSRRLGYGITRRAGTPSQSLMGMLLGRAAASEALRRLLVTALALERYRLQIGSYPQSLNDLTPKFLAECVTDFMDDKPLRYRGTDGGHFVLYSIGLDCIDQGGDMRQVACWYSDRGSMFYRLGPENDLVWPRPASRIEIENQQAEENARREVQASLTAVAMRGDRKQVEETIKKYPNAYDERIEAATGSMSPASALTNDDRVSE
jgi:hypothetical protein